MKSRKVEGATEEQQDDLDLYASLDSLLKTDGGKALRDLLLKDTIHTIGVLENQYKTLSHIEMIAYCAALSEKLSLLRALTRSSKNLDDLKKMIADTLQE